MGHQQSFYRGNLKRCSRRSVQLDQSCFSLKAAICLIPGFSIQCNLAEVFVQGGICGQKPLLETRNCEGRMLRELQIHAAKQGFYLGVCTNTLKCLLTIDGCFYRLLVLSPERNWPTMATSQFQNCDCFGHTYVPSETTFYCNNTKQMLPKLTPERPFCWQQLCGRAFGKAWINWPMEWLLHYLSR